MIVNASENIKKFEDIIKNSDFLGCKIYADYISSQAKETNSFYVADNSAFMLSGVNLTLCGNPAQDELEEILAFCNFCHVKSIESQIPTLPMKVDKQLHIMQYTGGKTQSCDDMVRNENIYSFVKFCCENFHGISFDIVYSNFTRKVNKGISDVYYLTDGEKITSGAISTDYGDDTVYITFVSTRPEYRKNGLATKVVGHIISRNSGKKIILKCEDRLKPFYKNMGFKDVGTVKLYKE